MKCYLIQSKNKCWTNRAAREALGVEVDDQLTITVGANTVRRYVRPAPSAASKVIRSVYAAGGVFGVAVDADTLSELCAKAGDTAEVVSVRAIQAPPRTASTAQSHTPAQLETLSSAKPESLRVRIARLAAGDELEVTASQAAGGAYSVAKELGFRVKKVGETKIKRVS